MSSEEITDVLDKLMSGEIHKYNVVNMILDAQFAEYSRGMKDCEEIFNSSFRWFKKPKNKTDYEKDDKELEEALK